MINLAKLLTAALIATTLVATTVTTASAEGFASKQDARNFNRGIKQQIREVKSNRAPAQQQVRSIRNDLKALKQDFRAGNLNRNEFRTQRSSLQQSLQAARQQVKPFNTQIRSLRTQLVNLKTFTPTLPVAATTPILPVVSQQVGQQVGQQVSQQIGRNINAIRVGKINTPTPAGLTTNVQRTNLRPTTGAARISPSNSPITLPTGQGTLLSLVADESMAQEVNVDVEENVSVAFDATPQLLNAMNTLTDTNLKHDIYSRAVKVDIKRIANNVKFDKNGVVTFSHS